MNKIKFIDNTTLKILACIFMVIDHVGLFLFPDIVILRIIGRLAYPIFAFCISEGFHYTKSKRNYLIRLLCFALISEPIFNLVNNGTLFYLGYQNVLFTFSLAVFFLWICDKLKDNKELKRIVYFIPEVILFITFFLIAVILKIDYNGYGFTLVIVFYYLRNKELYRNICIPITQLIFLRGYSLVSILSIFIIMLYNEKKGRSMKYFFYLFYPLHLLIIYLLTLYL